MKKKRVVSVILSVVFLLPAAFAGAQGEMERTAPTPFTLEVIGHGEEYIGTEQAIWDLYMEQNPHVTVEVRTINEDQRTAFEARLAGGDAPAITLLQYPIPNKENYELYVNLKDIGYEHWDKIREFDAKAIWTQNVGVEYTPGLVWQGGRYFSFIYHSEEMIKAGFDPASSVRTWEDLDTFLGELKRYINNVSEYEYVLDFAWHSWIFGQQLMPMLANGLGGDLESQYKVYKGEIAWTDSNNPFRPAFEKMKEWTDKGYFPAQWWTRDWGQDYEAGFVGKKSILSLHGPWLWDKVEAADASAKLDGFPIPTVNGRIVGINVKYSGAGIYAVNKEKPYYDEIVEAFKWTTSPEIMKLRCEGMNSLSTLDLTEFGGLELTGTQYKKIIKRSEDGFFGNIEMDFSSHPADVAARYRIDGNPNVLNDNGFAVFLAEYLSGDISLDELMEICQTRWEAAYRIE